MGRDTGRGRLEGALGSKGGEGRQGRRTLPYISIPFGQVGEGSVSGCVSSHIRRGSGSAPLSSVCFPDLRMGFSLQGEYKWDLSLEEGRSEMPHGGREEPSGGEETTGSRKRDSRKREMEEKVVGGGGGRGGQNPDPKGKEDSLQVSPSLPTSPGVLNTAASQEDQNWKQFQLITLGGGQALCYASATP